MYRRTRLALVCMGNEPRLEVSSVDPNAAITGGTAKCACLEGPLLYCYHDAEIPGGTAVGGEDLEATSAA